MKKSILLSFSYNFTENENPKQELIEELEDFAIRTIQEQKLNLLTNGTLEFYSETEEVFYSGCWSIEYK